MSVYGSLKDQDNTNFDITPGRIELSTREGYNGTQVRTDFVSHWRD
jgi:hypothetical protein